MRMHRHHLLEIILWPNGDGTFRKILNSAKRLKELGIYDDWKLTITIPADEHSKMHARNRSEEHRAKISAANKGKKPWNKDKKLSDDTKAKISAAQIGKKLSDDTKAKLSAAQKGYKHSEEAKAKMSAAKKGKKFTAEHRAKISAAGKGKKRSDATKAKMSAAKKGKKYEQS
jgi:retron-type reverse transcriptase